MSTQDLSQASMLDLFRIELENQSQVLTTGLLELERNPRAAGQLEACMRAAHSLKGAGRIVNLEHAVEVAHAMEDCLVGVQSGRIDLERACIDVLLRGVDLLQRMVPPGNEDLISWSAERRQEVGQFVTALHRAERPTAPSAAPSTAPAIVPSAAPSAAPSIQAAQSTSRSATDADTGARDSRGAMLRVTTDNLNRLLGLAGESLVESRWLQSFAESLLRLKRQQYDLGISLEKLRESLAQEMLSDDARNLLADAQRRAMDCRQVLSQRLAEIETFDRRVVNLSHRLYEGALACRMRPFADGVQGLPRMVRDLARTLGKQVRLEIIGEDTQVDRDILEKLEAPLAHLLRNAIDHGMETPEERVAAGKCAEGLIRIEARHSAGRLQICVADDGCGIDLERLRATVVQRNLSPASTAGRLSEAELLEFLFLPGFTLKDAVTEISGRGVGLDVVHDVLKKVRGTVRISTERKVGTRFQLQLPLTLSIVRTLLVEVDNEPYAIPLAYIERTLKIERGRIAAVEGRPHFALDGRHIGLVTAHQVLTGGQPQATEQELVVVVLGDTSRSYGLIVDRLLGEHELVVQTLDTRLGKIKDIAAGALTEDGSPVLIIDVEDLTRSIEKLATAGGLDGVTRSGANFWQTAATMLKSQSMAWMGGMPFAPASSIW
jgi:two-component system sensor histidine kinase and response regulator WspE